MALNGDQRPLGNNGVRPKSVSASLYATLERLARLVDITYCVGTTGVSKPFECVSRCDEFPSLELVNTWNTGPLLSDSCGYIAVDHGVRQKLPGISSGTILNTEDPAIVIAFRGTYSIANTVMDLSTIPQKYVPYPSPDDGGQAPEEPGHQCNNCTVHMGFLESWQNTRDVVIPQLRELRQHYPSHAIQIVGHSLGGAVACLAALELRVTLGWEDVTVTTFGEPRVGNEGFVRFVDEVFGLGGTEKLEERPYRRVTHKNDPVPLLPLGEWGYKPHAGEIYISRPELSPVEDDVHTCVGDEDPQCIADSDGSIWEIVRRLAYGRDIMAEVKNFPARFKLWQLFFAHRDYFWRLGLCVPGGDPSNWVRNEHELEEIGEL